jgi:hypothetical protein
MFRNTRDLLALTITLTVLIILPVIIIQQVNNSNQHNLLVHDRSFNGLHVEGNRLLDASNQEVTLIGVNFWGYSANTDGMNGHLANKGSSVRPEAAWTYQRIRELGFNTIRRTISLKWWMNNPDNYRQKIDQSITWAEEHSLYYLLTLANYDSDHFPWDPMGQAGYDSSDFQALWNNIAQRYTNKYPNLIYALGNEPTGGGDTRSQWPVMCQTAINTIRQYDQDHVILAPGIRASADLTPFFTNPLQDSGAGIIYDSHFYWSTMKEEVNNDQSYSSIVTGINDNSGEWRRVLDLAQRHPVIVGEFGTSGNYQWAESALKIFREYNIKGWCAWCWDGSTGSSWGGDLVQKDWKTLTSRGRWYVNRVEPWIINK